MIVQLVGALVGFLLMRVVVLIKNWAAVEWDNATKQWVDIGAQAATSALGSPVTMTNANTFYDGPSITLGPLPQATTWFISASVTVGGSGTAGFATGKLWDGTTVMDASETQVNNGAVVAGNDMAFDGTYSLPANTTATIKVSVASTTTGEMIYATTPHNATGNASRVVAARLD